MKKETHNYKEEGILEFYQTMQDENENLRLAYHYWENKSNISDEIAIREILIDGDIEVVQIVKQIHANL